jgi:hypothetical protein
MDASAGDAVAGFMPGLEAGTLLVRNVGETGFTSVAVFAARREPMKTSDLVMAGANVGETWLHWHFYNVDLLPAVPRQKDRYTDKDGVTWELRTADLRLFQTVVDALCCKDR